MRNVTEMTTDAIVEKINDIENRRQNRQRVAEEAAGGIEHLSDTTHDRLDREHDLASADISTLLAVLRERLPH